MDIKSIQKIGGISLILGSILFVVYTVCFALLIPLKTGTGQPSDMVQNPNWLWLAVTVFFGILLLIFGFSAIYSKIYNKTGVSGLVGYISIQIAYIFQAAKVTWEIFIYPVIVNNEKAIFLFNDNVLKHSNGFMIFRTAASLTILLGIILFSSAIIRSKEFSKSSGLLVLAGALIYGIGPVLNVYFAMAGIFIFAVGCLLLGKRLFE